MSRVKMLEPMIERLGKLYPLGCDDVPADSVLRSEVALLLAAVRALTCRSCYGEGNVMQAHKPRGVDCPECLADRIAIGLNK